MHSSRTTNYADQEYTELDRLLTETQLADRWQKSPKTLQNARVSGTGVAFVKIGHAVRYRLGDILAYENSNLRGSTSDEVGDEDEARAR